MFPAKRSGRFRSMAGPGNPLRGKGGGQAVPAASKDGAAVFFPVSLCAAASASI